MLRIALFAVLLAGCTDRVSDWEDETTPPYTSWFFKGIDSDSINNSLEFYSVIYPYLDQIRDDAEWLSSRSKATLTDSSFRVGVFDTIAVQISMEINDKEYLITNELQDLRYSWFSADTSALKLFPLEGEHHKGIVIHNSGTNNIEIHIHTSPFDEPWIYQVIIDEAFPLGAR